jgi:hypothetical protein
MIPCFYFFVESKMHSSSRRTLTGQHDIGGGSIDSALHINDGSIHTPLDDTVTNLLSCWSSSKTTNAIQSAAFDNSFGGITIAGMPTTVAEFEAFEWDDIGTEGVTVQDPPSSVNFDLSFVRRAVSSKGYFIPAQLDIGGWIKFRHTVSGLAGLFDSQLMTGVHFPHSGSKYNGPEVGMDATEFYSWYNGGFSSIVIVEGGVVKSVPRPYIDIQNDTSVITRVTRTSENLWTVEFRASGVWISDSCTFGSSFAHKHCHMYMGIIGEYGEKSAYIHSPQVIHSQWYPVAEDYTLKQDTENSLVCADMGGNTLLSISTSECKINQPLTTTQGISAHSDFFGYPCPVTSVFFSASEGEPYDADMASREMHIADTFFGVPNIPQIRPNNIYEIDMRGIITCFQHHITTLYVEVLLDTTVIVSSEYTSTMESLPGIVPFSLQFQMVMPIISTDTLDSISTLRGSGMFTYHGIREPTQAGMSGFGLTDHGGVTIGINYPGQLRVRFTWINADPGDRVQMLSTKYSCTGL